MIDPGTFVDPPDGWRYGFPREYTPRDGEDFDSWLVRMGYPKELLPLARKCTRCWVGK